MKNLSFELLLEPKKKRQIVKYFFLEDMNWRMTVLPAIAKHSSPLYMFAGHWCGVGD